ncbi:restriction endonuclease subunit S [Flavobacteriaceae bacterium XHP0103]|uniref:restriction endonuclease subunit S n=1 Tax=Marixanthotalea marina TaxID=2844359 RepID=UPI002989E33E|nr:restriction endonuclease subunit S [Marixanthotalea marina]MBU3822506.1 restriction endonuclease subunit S [Marixanthotalea marina]
MYGLKPHTIQAIQNVFAKYSNIEKAILYGSRAKGNYRNGSDIDLTLVGKNLTLSEQFSIETELDDLLLPYKIDLSIYYKIENQDLIDHIDRVGIVFYENESKDWEEVLIGEYIDLISGYAFKSKNFLENQIEGSLPVLKIKNVANGDVHLNGVQYHYYDDSLDKFVIEKGDILIAMTGNHPQAQSQVVGDVSRYRLKGKALLNQRVGKIVCFDTINEDFTYYFFKDDATHKYLANQSSGSANQANISKKNILEVPVNLPPLKEQQAIAEVLSSLDAKIDLLHRQNQTLEALAETLFRQWFVEEADENWGISKIGDEVKTVLGGTPSTKKKEYWDGDIPWINSGEVNKFRILNGTKFITELGLRKSNTKLLPKGTTVLAITGATLGQTSMLEIDTCANQSVVGVIPNEIFPKEFIFLWIKLKIEEIILNETGGAQPHINKNDVNETEIIVPDSDYMNKAMETISPMFKKITNNSLQIETLKKQRDTLLPKLMSGEVRVKIN